ncbi:hypothetical protein [Parasphingopyxis marina]|uniref:Sulfotransferase domain-containing protein n=1 Tax=Parasphingopyxis marina TaxID=2761622 RepID=A0A842I3M0_9SPHN|nr:hypothetical protein [Parasphingopyxis marina]MBC2779040.1 hypothetical protein [Parasphingopyxis marina]
MVPLVFHVGLMKSGSTSLQKAVKSASQVQFISAKEVKATSLRSVTAISKALSRTMPAAPLLPLFVSHEALVTVRAPKLITALAEYPEATVLVVWRPAVERFESHYKMAVTRAGLAQYPNDFYTARTRSFLRTSSREKISSLLRGRVEFLDFSEMRDSPTTFYDRISAMLSLPAGAIQPPEKAYNVAMSIDAAVVALNANIAARRLIGNKKKLVEGHRALMQSFYRIRRKNGVFTQLVESDPQLLAMRDRINAELAEIRDTLSRG